MGVTMQKFVPSYKPRGKSPGFGTFGQFMVSDQMRRPMRVVAREIAGIGRMIAPRSKDERDGHYADQFTVETEGLTTVVGKQYPNERVMVRVGNSAKNAVAVEFGSGAAGQSSPVSDGERPQGGWSKAERPLLRAGLKVGRPLQGGDE